jgi:hypothetical protein
LIRMWWTRRARNQALGVNLWIGILLGIFAVKAEHVSGTGVRGVFGIGPFAFARLVSFCELLLLRLLLHAHPEVIV